jgi:hypothetical protein
MAIEPYKRTLPELIKTAKALNSKLAHSEGKSADLKITLGLTLAEAKACKPEDITWPDFVKKHFDFGRSRADELIQIADGRTTVEKTRETKAVSVRKSRAKSPLRSGGSPEAAAAAPYAGPSADAIEASKRAAMNAQADRAEATSAAMAKRPKLDADCEPPKLSEFQRVDGQVKPLCHLDAEDAADVEEPGDTMEMIRHRIFLHRASEALRHARENGFDDAFANEITEEIVDASWKAADAWADLNSDLETPHRETQQTGRQNMA